MYVCMHGRMYVGRHVCMCVFTHVCMHVCSCASKYVSMYEDARMDACMRAARGDLHKSQ